jgi:hypothetical protein
MGHACAPAPHLFGPAFGTNPLMYVEGGIRWENVTILPTFRWQRLFRRAESIVSSLILVSHLEAREFYVLRDSPLK